MIARFMFFYKPGVTLADGAVDEAPSDDGNDEEPALANQVVVPVANPAASSSSAAQ
jgi:hypothetical protein